MEKIEINQDLFVDLDQESCIHIDGGGSPLHELGRMVGRLVGRASYAYASYAAEYGQHNAYGT